MKACRFLALVLIGSLQLGAAVASSAELRPPLELTIVHVSDLDRMEAREGRGGLSKLASLLGRLRAERDFVLFTHGGDALSPSFMSSFDQGRHMIELLNSLGLDAFVLGNHEFDFGREVLKERAREANFPLLAANLLTAEGEKFAEIEDRLLLSRGDWKIGIFGLLTPDTLTSSSPGDVLILSELEVAPQQAEALRAEGADFVLALAHSNRETDLELARQGAADLILGGHDHIQHLFWPSGGSPFLETGAQGEHVAVIELLLEENTSGETQWLASFSFIDTSHIEADPAMRGRIESYLLEVEQELARDLAVTETRLDSRRGLLRSGETAFGNLVADALREATNADVAIQNAGGLRGETVYPAGSLLRAGDIMGELPFLNQVVLLEVSGKTLQEVLEQGLSRAPEPSGSFPQVSGLQLRYDPHAPPGERLLELLVEEEPLDPERRYRLAVNSFMAGGGGGYEMLRDAKPLSHPAAQKADSMVVRDYLRELGRVAPRIEGRISALD